MGRIQLLKGLRFIIALAIVMIGIATSNDLVAVILFSILFVLPYGFEVAEYYELKKRAKTRRLK